MIIYAQCRTCKRRFIIEFENEEDATEYPCEPCPECNGQDVESDLRPSIAILLNETRFGKTTRIWIRDGEKVRSDDF